MNCKSGFPDFTISQNLLKLTSIESVMPYNYLILCCHLLLLSIFPSIRVFSRALHIRCPKYWNFSFSISPSSEYSRLTSFRIDWFNLLAVQGTLKSLFQHHSLKASILWCSAFFMVQLSHPYMTTGKTRALTICTFVGKVMFLLFNTLSRFVIAFLPRGKCLNFMAVVTIRSDFRDQENKVCHCFHCFPICHEVMGPDAVIFVFWMLNFKPAFSLSSFNLIKRLFSSSSHSAIRVVSSDYLRLLIFFPSNLDSSLWFIQPGISLDISA